MAKDIKTAYYNLAKLYHPDAKKNEKEAKEHLQKFQEVNEAYKILGDESKRFEYDKYGFVKVDTASAPRPFFKQNINQASKSVVKVQEDARAKEIPVPMTFMQSVHGITKEVNIKLLVPCDVCCKNAENSPVLCTYCNGRGYQACKENKIKQIACKFCQGSKYSFKNTCVHCGGYGNQVVSKRINVKIPPNSNHNDVVRVKHPFEDEELSLILKLENNEQFKIVGLNIFSNVYIPFTMAILGGYVSMPTIYGDQTVKIQPGTDMNTIIRLPAKGVKKEGGQVGDHVATIIVKMPRSITERQRSLLEAFVAIESHPQDRTKVGNADGKISNNQVENHDEKFKKVSMTTKPTSNWINK